MIALGAYAALNGYLVSVHEPWRDEALAWTIARDLSPAGIIRQMSVEGHPCLWYFLLLPLTRAGLPILSMCVLSCVLMVLATAVFLLRSPFPRWLRVLHIFTPLFTYMYPVISRSYALAFLFTVCLAALEKKKWEHPWLYCLFLGLLVQTHVIMLGMAGVLSLVFLVQRTDCFHKEGAVPLMRRLLPLLLPLGSLFWLLVQLSHIQDSASMEAERVSFLEFCHRLWQTVPYTMSMYMDIGGMRALCLAGAVLALCIYGVVRWHLIGETISFLGGIVAQLVIYTVLNGPTSQRALTWFLLFVWYLWVCLERAKSKEYLILLLPPLAVSMWLCSVRLYPYMVKDIHGKFSDAENVTKAVEAVVPENGTVIMTDAATAPSVAAYLTHKGIRIFCPQENAYITYTNWDSNWNRSMTQEEMLTILAENGLSRDGFYIVIDSGNVVENLQTQDWELLYKTSEEAVFHEEFSLYYVPPGK